MQNSNVCQVTAGSGAIPQRKRYAPYGASRQTTPVTFPNTDRGFLNQPHDTNGLVYLNNRYHDPQLGAFISVDPLVGQTGMPYLYGDGSPATLSDPTGLATCMNAGGVVTRYNAVECTYAEDDYASHFGEHLWDECAMRCDAYRDGEGVPLAWVPNAVFFDANFDRPELLSALNDLERYARMPLGEFEEAWRETPEILIWDWTNDGCSDGGLVTLDSFGCVRHDFVYRNLARIDAEFDLDGALLGEWSMKDQADKRLSEETNPLVYLGLKLFGNLNHNWTRTKLKEETNNYADPYSDKGVIPCPSTLPASNSYTLVGCRQ